jgi:hypothetical protein
MIYYLWTQTLLGLGVSVSDTCPCRYPTPTPTLMITLNYIIFSNYYQCRRVSVRVVSSVRVGVRLHCLLQMLNLNIPRCISPYIIYGYVAFKFVNLWYEYNYFLTEDMNIDLFKILITLIYIHVYMKHQTHTLYNM